MTVTMFNCFIVINAIFYPFFICNDHELKLSIEWVVAPMSDCRLVQVNAVVAEKLWMG